jgi:hypothetical protein
MSFHRSKRVLRFKRNICDEKLKLANTHHIIPAFIDELSAVVGEKLWRNRLRRVGLLQSNVSLRFTKNNPAKLKLHFATPRLISAYKRRMGATECNREAPPLKKAKFASLLHGHISPLEKAN